MCLWYGCSHVIIEGWNTLGHTDSVINQLFTSTNKDPLRGCRNDTFHFQKEYHPKHFVKLVSDNTTAKWVRDLNQNFDRFFLEQFEARKKRE